MMTARAPSASISRTVSAASSRDDLALPQRRASRAELFAQWAGRSAHSAGDERNTPGQFAWFDGAELTCHIRPDDNQLPKICSGVKLRCAKRFRS